MGITVVILRLVSQCETCMRCQYINSDVSSLLLEFFVDRLFEGDDRAAHLEFFTFIIQNATLFDRFLYEYPPTYARNPPASVYGRHGT